MKHLSNIVLLFALTAVAFLSGCSSSAEAKFVKLLRDSSVKDINQSIHLVIEGQLTPGSEINLLVYNQSTNPIAFLPGAEAQIFLFSPENDQWEEIANEMNYSGEMVILDTKETADILPFSIWPDLPTNEKEQKLRVAITGYVVKDGETTDEPVSAFVEFVVKP